MKMRLSSLVLIVAFLVSPFSYGKRNNQCRELFDINIGYNAFINIADYSFGRKPNLRKARTIYEYFPNGNESLRQTGLFLIDYTIKVNNPPIETIFAETNKANGQLLSNLTFCSKFVGEIEYRKIYKKLKSVAEYQEFYYPTFILGYAMGWDRNSINEDFDTNATSFINDYDTYLLKAKPMTESELMLYKLFKLEIGFEINKDENSFLANLDELILAHPAYFSLLNYQQYIKEYFPKHIVPAKLAVLKKDSYDRDDENPIYKTIKNDYKLFAEAVDELALNPFDDFLERYSNVKRLLPKTSFAELIKQINKTDTLIAATKQKCYLSAIAQNFTTQVIDCNDKRFTKSQAETLKVIRFKKWINTYIACNITFTFYMDKSLISEWNALSKSNQEMLSNYFIKALDASDKHSYLLQLQKTLKIKA